MRIFPFQRTTPEEREQDDVKNMLRDTFSGPQGVEALSWFLMNLRYYDAIESEEDRILHNFANFVLESMGINQVQNLYGLTQAALSLPVWEEDGVEDE